MNVIDKNTCEILISRKQNNAPSTQVSLFITRSLINMITTINVKVMYKNKRKKLLVTFPAACLVSKWKLITFLVNRVWELEQKQNNSSPKLTCLSSMVKTLYKYTKTSVRQNLNYCYFNPIALIVISIYCLIWLGQINEKILLLR